MLLAEKIEGAQFLWLCLSYIIIGFFCYQCGKEMGKNDP